MAMQVDNPLKYMGKKITAFTNMLATVTQMDIEIVDADLIRLGGTGGYAAGIGESIEDAGELYFTAMRTMRTICLDNPREHPICRACPNLRNCREMLNICSPIVVGGKTVGIIGLLCFSEERKKTVLANKTFYMEFLEQTSHLLAMNALERRSSRQAERKLDMLMRVTDSNPRIIIVFSRGGRISFCNEMARKELAIPEDYEGTGLELSKTGNTVLDADEFVVRLPHKEVTLFGNHIWFEDGDDSFANVLVAESTTSFAGRLGADGRAASAVGAGVASIIGESPVVGQLKKRVLQIADSVSTVLITGESGTGKEIFARAIHAESDRRDQPFIAINCGAIPGHLLESELFGYVSGAFTGANRSGRMGKFELANHGVVFLDEVSSMSLHLQVKLLRVLQDRSFTRLGSNRLISVDVRIIAATNEDLQALVAERMFREDLYYRLNVIPIHLPPLRERKKDIPQLGEFFLSRFCTSLGKWPMRLSPAMVEKLQHYPWPGNVREFQNCMEYMVNINPGGDLTCAMLPRKISEAAMAAHHDAQRSFRFPSGGGSASPPPAQAAPIVPLRELEENAVRQALAVYGDTVEGKTQAAAALGIGVATIYRKLRAMQGG